MSRHRASACAFIHVAAGQGPLINDQSNQINRDMSMLITLIDRYLSFSSVKMHPIMRHKSGMQLTPSIQGAHNLAIVSTNKSRQTIAIANNPLVMPARHSNHNCIYTFDENGVKTEAETQSEKRERWIQGAPTVVTMLLHTKWQNRPPLQPIQRLCNALMLIAAAIVDSITTISPSVIAWAEHVEGLMADSATQIPDELCLKITKKAVPFPDLLGMDPSQARDFFRMYFDALLACMEKPDYIPDDLQTYIKNMLGGIISEMPMENDSYFFGEFSKEGTAQWWPILDNIPALRAIGCLDLDQLFVLLQNVGPCKQCSQCNGSWHTIAKDLDGNMLVYNHFDGNVFESGNNNMCQVCNKTILCCTNQGTARKCELCDTLICYRCEYRHLKEHSKCKTRGSMKRLRDGQA